jgi:hypothetical protein
MENPEPARATPHGDEPLNEFVGGQRVDLPPLGAFHSHIASSLACRIGVFAAEHRLGKVILHTLFHLDPQTGLQRRPKRGVYLERAMADPSPCPANGCVGRCS